MFTTEIQVHVIMFLLSHIYKILLKGVNSKTIKVVPLPEGYYDFLTGGSKVVPRRVYVFSNKILIFISVKGICLYTKSPLEAPLIL